MKIALFRLGLLVPLFLGCAKQDIGIGDFKTFTSKEGWFTAEFPGVPTAREQELDSPIGKMTAHFYVLQIWNAVAYSASYCDLPTTVTEQQRKAFNVDAAFVGTRDGIARGTNTRVTNEADIMLDKWPGREWRLASTGDATEDFLWRCYYVNTRQYQICVGWQKGHEPPKEIADKFLNSLKILPE